MSGNTNKSQEVNDRVDSNSSERSDDDESFETAEEDDTLGQFITIPAESVTTTTIPNLIHETHDTAQIEQLIRQEYPQPTKNNRSRLIEKKANEEFNRDVTITYKQIPQYKPPKKGKASKVVKPDRFRSLAFKEFIEDVPRHEPSTGSNQFKVVSVKRTAKNDDSISRFDLWEKCQHCGKIYKGFKSTSHKQEHIKRCHPEKYNPRANKRKVVT